MKRVFLSLVLFSICFGTKSQVVFCPPGAQWSYNYFIMFYSGLFNDKVSYIGDTTLTGVLTKKLLSKRFYTACNNPWKGKITYLQQRGDTIFFMNNYTNGWQVFINYAATQGQGWKTSYKQDDGSISTYTFLVQSVSTITLNGISLKSLSVLTTFTRTQFSTNTYTYNMTVNERIGYNSIFFFPFDNKNDGFCDSDYATDFLCYTDNNFGTYQTGTNDCDYRTVGINEIDKDKISLSVFPNPVSYNLNLNSESETPVNLILTNVLGETVMQRENFNPSESLDVSAFPRGVYFLTITIDDRKINKRIVKN